MRTSEIEKIIFDLFSLFLLKIISAYESFSFLVIVSRLSCVKVCGLGNSSLLLTAPNDVSENISV